MANLHIVVVSGATALDLLFGGLTATPNPKGGKYICVANTVQIILLD